MAITAAINSSKEITVHIIGDDGRREVLRIQEADDGRVNLVMPDVLAVTPVASLEFPHLYHPQPDAPSLVLRFYSGACVTRPMGRIEYTSLRTAVKFGPGVCSLLTEQFTGASEEFVLLDDDEDADFGDDLLDNDEDYDGENDEDEEDLVSPACPMWTPTEVDFGAWWSTDGTSRGPYWRVSWRTADSELYATRRVDGKEETVHLGYFATRDAVDEAMKGCYDPYSPIYHNLAALKERLGVA